MAPYRFFDHASTTSVCESALKAWIDTERTAFGNATSTHQLGRAAAGELEAARATLAEVIGVTAPQIVFTGSGTEADNLAIQGAGLQELNRLRSRSDSVFRNEIFISAAEHPAVTSSAMCLKTLGFEVYEIPLQPDGQLDQTWLLERVSDRTLLISCMQVHNVVGTWFNLDVFSIIKKRYPSIIIHSDCVQSFCKIPLPTSSQGVDLLSISAHKIHGPKGIGALIATDPLFFRNGNLRGLCLGGGQEHGLRSGTSSPALAQAFAQAAVWTASNQASFSTGVETLRQRLKQGLGPLLQSGTLTWVEAEQRIAHVVCLGVKAAPSKWVASQLDRKGFGVSSGSACSSNKTATQDAMALALTQDPACAQSILRFSFGHDCKLGDVEALTQALHEVLQDAQKLLST